MLHYSIRFYLSNLGRICATFLLFPRRGLNRRVFSLRWRTCKVFCCPEVEHCGDRRANSHESVCLLFGARQVKNSEFFFNFFAGNSCLPLLKKLKWLYNNSKYALKPKIRPRRGRKRPVALGGTSLRITCLYLIHKNDNLSSRSLKLSLRYVVTVVTKQWLHDRHKLGLG